MIRVKTFDATGVAPGGRLYAGDLNAIQDAAAGKSDFTQTVDMATLRVGDSGIQLLKYGAGEARLTSALRTDGIVRALGGLYPGGFTTAQRDAIASGLAPYGLSILNSTTNRYEWNKGTDAARVWVSLAPEFVRRGVIANIPAASSVDPGFLYYAGDMDVMYSSTGGSWTRIGSQAGDLFLTMNNTASVGRILLQGQAWPGTTGIYADLWAKWGAQFPTNLPDMRGRVPVVLGTHVDHNTIGNNDGLAVGSRRTKHKHLNSLAGDAHVHNDGTLTVASHTHADGTLTVVSHNHGGGVHNHAITDPGHVHTATRITGAGLSGPAGGTGGDTTGNTGSATTGITVNNSVGTVSAEAPDVTGATAAAAPDVTGNTGSAGSTISGGIGPQTGSEPTDTVAYMTVNMEAKL